jgi:hypothetical protein
MPADGFSGQTLYPRYCRKIFVINFKAKKLCYNAKKIKIIFATRKVPLPVLPFCQTSKKFGPS